MSDILIMNIVFEILLILCGITLIVLSYILGYKYLIQEKRCTEKTKGIVKKYTFFRHGGENSGVHLPVVFYKVNGKEYKVVGPEYKFFIEKIKSTPTSENKATYYEYDQIFYINRTINSITGISTNSMREMFPIDTEIDVYYDPTKPKLAYVLRYCNKKFMFYLMFIAGIAVLIMGICMLLF